MFNWSKFLPDSHLYSVAAVSASQKHLSGRVAPPAFFLCGTTHFTADTCPKSKWLSHPVTQSRARCQPPPFCVLGCHQSLVMMRRWKPKSGAPGCNWALSLTCFVNSSQLVNVSACQLPYVSNGSHDSTYFLTFGGVGVIHTNPLKV